MVKRIIVTMAIGLFIAVSGLDVGVANGASISKPAPDVTYAALGDSVAAGLGLPLTGEGGTAADCGRSAKAYPYLVAQKRDLTLTNIACSGATAGDLVTRQSVAGTEVPAQLTTAFKNGTPGVISITAGANDAHWTTFLGKCYATTCGSKADTLVANGYLKVLQLKLYYMFGSIQRRSHGKPPKTILTGYYNPISSACTSVSSRFTASEVTWVTGEINALNQTIKNVTAHYSFAKYVPVDFTGHDICAATPWIQGANTPAPFHPTEQGQAAIARSVLSAF